MSTATERRAAFAALHRRGDPLFLPNAWDVASAAALAHAGHPTIGTTSFGVAAAVGEPDGAGATRDETLALVRRLGLLPILLTVDVEAGFSDEPAEVADLAEQLAAAGAVGVNIEDGRPDGTLAPTASHCAKVAAVRDRVPDLFVNARTDAFWLDAVSPADEAVQRAAAYVAAGADGIFVPGVADLDTIRVLADGIAAPLNVLYAPDRHTLADLAATGVARVSLGSLLFRAALLAVVRLADEVSRPGDAPRESVIASYAEVRAMISGSDG